MNESKLRSSFFSKSNVIKRKQSELAPPNATLIHRLRQTNTPYLFNSIYNNSFVLKRTSSNGNCLRKQTGRWKLICEQHAKASEAIRHANVDKKLRKREGKKKKLEAKLTAEN
jgi:hypothetical protein